MCCSVRSMKVSGVPTVVNYLGNQLKDGKQDICYQEMKDGFFGNSSKNRKKKKKERKEGRKNEQPTKKTTKSLPNLVLKDKTVLSSEKGLNVKWLQLFALNELKFCQTRFLRFGEKGSLPSRGETSKFRCFFQVSS